MTLYEKLRLESQIIKQKIKIYNQFIHEGEEDDDYISTKLHSRYFDDCSPVIQILGKQLERLIQEQYKQ